MPARTYIILNILYLTLMQLMKEENDHCADVKRELERIKSREDNIYSRLEHTKRTECISPVQSPSIASPKSALTCMSDESSKLPMLQLVYSDYNGGVGETKPCFEYTTSFDSKLSEGEVDINPGAYSDGEEMILTPRQR